MPACICGYNDAKARFCRDCGRRLGEADERLLLLDDTSNHTSEAVVHGWSIRQRWLSMAAVCLAILICGGLWSVLRTPSADISETQEARKTPADSDPNETPPTALFAKDPAPRQPIANTGPLLGQDVDYKLLISTSGRLAVLDLNNGEVQYIRGLPVRPVAVSGDWVVVERATGSRIASLPLNDLGASPARLLDEQDVLSAKVLPTLGPAIPGQLWVLASRRTEGNQEEIRQSFDLLDLSSGAIIDHPLAGEMLLATRFLGAAFADRSGGLITSFSGGVYATTADGYRQVTDGRLITADTTRALVETCDSTLSCQQGWFDRNTWQPLDLPVPSDVQPVVIMVPGTDWVFSRRLGATGTASLFNIRTGQTVDVRLPDSATSIVLPAVSPDGIWLAEPAEDPQTLALRDLATGDTTLVTLDQAIDGPMFFIQE